MTGRNRFSTAVLIIALFLTASSSAWAGARAWTESKTVHYRSNLTVVIDGRVATPEVTPFIVEPGWLMVPAEFIAKELGAYVDWDDTNSVLTITSSMEGSPIIEVQDDVAAPPDRQGEGRGSKPDKDDGEGGGNDNGDSRGNSDNNDNSRNDNSQDNNSSHSQGNNSSNSQDNNSSNSQGNNSSNSQGNNSSNSQGNNSSNSQGESNGKGGIAGAVPSSDPKSLKEVISDVSPSVVLITTYDASGMGISQGSGVVVAENTIITNQHVIHGASKVLAIDSAGGVHACSGTLAIDTYRDLALLECEIPVEPVALGDSDAVAVGDSVVAIGNPRGLQGTVSTGIVSGLREFSGVSYVQTTAPTSPGSSGGGLFTMDSSLIGITTLIFKDSQNLNLVVPVSYVKDLMAKPAELKPYPTTQAPNPTSDTKPVARYFDEVD